MKDLVTEIWEIRGMVDDARVNKDMDLATKAYNRFMKICEAKVYLESLAASTINRPGNFEVQEDRRENWDRLVFNLGYQIARINGGQVIDLPYGKAKSLLDIVWLARAMFDDCVYASSNPKETDKILTRLEAVEGKLLDCYDCCRCSNNERASLMNIRLEISETRKDIFGNKKAPSLFDTESSVY